MYAKGAFSMKHKRFARLLSMLLVVVTMFGVMSLPANAASLNDSGTVTIQQAGYGKYLTKSSGGTIGGGYWKYTSNNGLTGHRLLRQSWIERGVPLQGPDRPRV